MLNKLLKRHAPWMDKGRWYKISVSADSAACDNIFETPSSEHEQWEVRFKPDFNGTVIDYKITQDVLNVADDPSNHVISNVVTPLIEYDETGAYVVIPLPFEGEILTCWLFIRPVELKR